MGELPVWSWLIIVPGFLLVMYIRHKVLWGKRLYTKCPNCKESVPRLEKGTHNCSICNFEFEVDDIGVGTPQSLGFSIILLLVAMAATYLLLFPDNSGLPHQEDSTLRIILNLSILVLAYGLSFHGLLSYYKRKK